MEDTIGYDSLFSPEQWDAIERADWSAFPADEEFGPGARRHVARVFGPPGQHQGDEERFDVECDSCGHVGAGGDEQEADAIALLHEALGAVVVPNPEAQ
ncbi:MAG: hypothetical protein M3285_02985 [Actinomycetota bacterium]|nr:hypothetical protein [Actinomycetota bacterium]MDQ3954497.1 hypothetical protein [Actinomycetota bacterium]